MSDGKGCEHCGKYTTTRCGSCKAIAVCSRECMKALWKSHKPDCKKVQTAREAMEATGHQMQVEGSIPSSMDGNRLLDITAKSTAVYAKFGLDEPPTKDSNMPRRKKLAFFLEMLQANDATSDENKTLPLGEKLFLNRRYNNTYQHAMEYLTQNELYELSAHAKGPCEYLKQNT